jgi:hypothetical protein
MNDREIGVPFLVGAINFSLLHDVQTGSATQPASSTIGTLEIWQQGREADSSLSHAEVENGRASPPPTTGLHDVMLI